MFNGLLFFLNFRPGALASSSSASTSLSSSPFTLPWDPYADIPDKTKQYRLDYLLI